MKHQGAEFRMPEKSPLAFSCPPSTALSADQGVGVGGDVIGLTAA